MKKTAIYIRVSSDKQAKEGDSIPAHLAALTKYVNERPNLVIAGEYIDDGISGQKYAQRDELQRLLDDVKAGKIDLICFTKLDRWFRSVRHYTATQELLDKHKVDWLAIWEPVYDTTTPSGRLIVNQMMSIAQFEAENTGQRIRSVFDYKASKGEVLSGSTPPGYSIKDKHLVPNEVAEAVQDAFMFYSVTGNLRQTMLKMQGRGLPNTLGAYKNMLSNTKYIGLFRGNPNYCPPIIEKSVFEDVQRKLSINIKVSQKHTYLFSGLIVCGECGRKMGANLRRRQRGNSYSETPQYRCVGHYCHVPRCSNTKIITEAALEKHLLSKVRLDLENMVFTYEQHQGKQQNIEATKKAIQRKIDRLKELYINDLIDLSEYKVDKATLEQELSAVQDDTQSKKDMSTYKALLDTDFETLYRDMTRSEKQFFWRSTIQSITMGLDREYKIQYINF